MSVVEQVDPPQVGQGDIGDQRKLKSYNVESYFYQNLAESLITAGVPVAQPLDLQVAHYHTCIWLVYDYASVPVQNAKWMDY